MFPNGSRKTVKRFLNLCKKGKINSDENQKKYKGFTGNNDFADIL